MTARRPATLERSISQPQNLPPTTSQFSEKAKLQAALLRLGYSKQNAVKAVRESNTLDECLEWLLKNSGENPSPASCKSPSTKLAPPNQKPKPWIEEQNLNSRGNPTSDSENSNNANSLLGVSAANSSLPVISTIFSSKRHSLPASIVRSPDTPPSPTRIRRYSVFSSSEVSTISDSIRANEAGLEKKEKNFFEKFRTIGGRTKKLFSSLGSKDESRSKSMKVQRAVKKPKLNEIFKVPKPDYGDTSLSARQKVALEILHSERTYVASLGMMLEAFCFPLEDSIKEDEDPILSAEPLEFIFSEIKTILEINKLFLSELEERMSYFSEETTTLGDIFIKYGRHFVIYSQYINKYDKILELVKENRTRNLDFNRFLEEQSRNPDLQMQAFEAFQIMPIQRVPRYELLLQNLLKNTRSHHPDFNKITEALVMIKQTAQKINSSKNETENSTKMWEIQNLLGDLISLIKPHRKFIMEGDMSVLSRRGLVKAHGYLFNDCLLLILNRKRSMFRESTAIRDTDLIGFLELANVEGITQLPPEKNKPDMQYGIRLNFLERTIYCYFSDESKKKTWLAELLRFMNEAIDNANVLNKNSNLRKKFKEGRKDTDALPEKENS